MRAEGFCFESCKSFVDMLSCLWMTTCNSQYMTYDALCIMIMNKLLMNKCIINIINENPTNSCVNGVSEYDFRLFKGI